MSSLQVKGALRWVVSVKEQICIYEKELGYIKFTEYVDSIRMVGWVPGVPDNPHGSNETDPKKTKMV